MIQFLFLILILLIHPSYGDLGTASFYNTPYSPTECFGNDESQFPSSGFFGAAGDGIWDNGAACGRQYLVKCISASVAGACKVGQTIQIRIVDYAPGVPTTPSARGTSIILSKPAFDAVANGSPNQINIEFQPI